MNENPGEMPNPLNPTPAASPEPNNPAPAAPSVEPSPTPAPAPTEATPAEAAPDPMARPMEQAPAAVPVAEPKKKKTGLIIGIVIAAVLLIGGAVAALLLLGGNKGDAVSAAVEKLMSGDVPPYTTMNGTIDVAISDTSSPVSNLKIALDANTSTSSLINSTTADVTATLTSGDSVTVELSEIYAENGDLYIKIDKLGEAVKDLISSVYGDMDEDVVDEAMGSINGVVKMIDGKWLKLSVDELKSMMSSTSDNDSMKCLTDFVGNAKSHNNSLAEMYRKNPFIGSTTEGVTIASKNSTVYKIVIDSEKYGAFSSEVQSSDLIKDFYECAGVKEADIATSSTEQLSDLPAMYVEVDKDNNFSRFYSSMDVTGADASVIMDLGFTYPASINVAEPTESESFMTVFQKVITQLFGSSNMDAVDFDTD